MDASVYYYVADSRFEEAILKKGLIPCAYTGSPIRLYAGDEGTALVNSPFTSALNDIHEFYHCFYQEYQDCFKWKTAEVWVTIFKIELGRAIKEENWKQATEEFDAFFGDYKRIGSQEVEVFTTIPVTYITASHRVPFSALLPARPLKNVEYDFDIRHQRERQKAFF